MKKIFNFFIDVLVWIIELPIRMDKSHLVDNLELKLLDYEYNHKLLNNDKSKSDLDLFTRLLNATRNCPAIILMDEVESLKSIIENRDNVTDELTINWIKRIELYSC